MVVDTKSKMALSFKEGTSTIESLTNSFIKEIENFRVFRPAMLILCDGQDLVDGSGLDVFECVRFLGREDVDGLEDRDEDLLPRAR